MGGVDAHDLAIPRYIGRIPVRNLWLLMLYASDLFRQQHRGMMALEDNPDDIPDLVAELLAHVVERRLRRNLSYGFQTREAVLGRVRGHVDMLTTERHQLLARGRVACRFEDLTINTPRNRFVRAALDVIARLVKNPEMAHRCRALANSLGHLGVSGEKPTRAEVSTDRFGRHDADDQFMVAAAKLAFDLALPTEDEGSVALARPDRDVVWIRRLFEKAIAGFYDVVLSPLGWRVSAGKPLDWMIESETAGIQRILPAMRTDVILDQRENGRRIVIDTKFTSLLTQGWYREESIRSGYLYQMYAYLRSQEGTSDPLAEHAAGLLLHPAIGDHIDETVVIQGHAIRFATVDLGATTSEVRKQLLRLVPVCAYSIDEGNYG